MVLGTSLMLLVFTWTPTTCTQDAPTPLDAAQAAARAAPEDPEARLEFGRALTRAGRREEAIECFTAAIELAPDMAQAYEWRGYCHAAEGASAAALADYTHALRLDPENAWTFLARGKTRAGLRDLRGAAEDFRQALRYQPDFAEAAASLGFLLGAGSTGSTGSAGEPAIPLLERALELDPIGDGDGRVHERLWLRLLRLEAGGDAQADDVGLESWLRSEFRRDAGWAESLVLFVLGRKSAEELESLISVRQGVQDPTLPPVTTRLCQARFHAAWIAARDGGAKEALFTYLDALESLASETWEWEGARVRFRALAERHAVPVWTGMRLSPPDPDFALAAGLDPAISQAITALDVRSMAGRVGLQVGDVILSIDGQPAKKEVYGAAIEARSPGESVVLEVLRGGRRSKFHLVLGVRR
jgi:tetratricopeptide (TPR) repeat protein